MDNDNIKNTFRSSIYQMLFSYLLRCICYVVGHSLNPNQMKRLSFITNNFINHDIVNFNSLLKNETKNPFQTMESDCRIKKRARRVDNLTTSNKSSIKHSSYTEEINPDDNQEKFDFKKMYYDLVIIKNNQEEEVVRLLKREKDLLSDKTYWKNKYLKLTEEKPANHKDKTIYMNNVTMNGSVVNSHDDVPIFNSPDVDVSVNKSNNQVYHQNYDNKVKNITDNKVINTTKIINQDKKQVKEDLKAMIFQEFEKLQVNQHTFKDKSFGVGNREFPSAFKTASSIPSYQAEKISQLQETISEIMQDEKSVKSTLTYKQSKFYDFIRSFVRNDSIAWNDFSIIFSMIDKFRHEYLSHVLYSDYDIYKFCSSRLNVSKEYKNFELKIIVFSIDDIYLQFFSFINSHFNSFYNFINLGLQTRKMNNFSMAKKIKEFIISNSTIMDVYFNDLVNCSVELQPINRDIEYPIDYDGPRLPEYINTFKSMNTGISTSNDSQDTGWKVFK